MLRCKWFFMALLTMALCYAGVTSFAGDDKKGSKEAEAARKMSPDAQAIADVAAAYRMVEYGRKNKAPEALIAAARVIGTTKCTKGTLTAKCKVSKPLEADEVKEATALLDEAVKMSNKSEAIMALAKQTREILDEKGRSPWGGAKVWSAFFRGDGVDVLDRYYLELRGGEFTCISVFGNGPPGLDIDLELWNDETNQMVASDRSVGPNGFIRAFIPTSARYRIHVINYTGNIPCYNYALRAY